MATGFVNQPGIVDGTAFVNITLVSNNQNTFCGSNNDGNFGNNDEQVSGPSGGGGYLYSFGSFNIDYKPIGGTQWVSATDLNGDYTGNLSPSSATANYSQGEWRYSNTNSEWVYGQLYLATSSSGGGNVNGIGRWQTRVATFLITIHLSLLGQKA